MEVTVSSGNLDIIASGTVFLADANADLTLRVSDVPNVEIVLEFKFTNDKSKEHAINMRTNGNKVSYECVNFTDSGTGVIEPIEVTTFKGKKMYITFWSYLLGKTDGRKKPRKVEYTVFLER